MAQDQDRPMRKKVADFLRQAPRRYPVISVVLACVVLVLLLWIVPNWQVPKSGLSLKDRLHQINENRKTVAQIVGGVFILVGLYIAWVRSKAMRDQAEVAREQQLTDLYVKAVEQLGSENLQIRLGGIYALERIARESPKDHWPIMEVLTAFVRENAPRRWEDLSGPQPGENDMPQPPPSKPSTDIQAVMTVIGRRSRTYYNGEEQPLDLMETHLAGADLRYAKLQGAFLGETDLQRAVLWSSKLQGAILSGANLQEARLEGANLIGAILDESNLQMARLSGADLTGANLEESNLQRAQLYKAILNSARLEGADLKGAGLKETNLQGADLQFARGLTTKQVAQAFWDDTTKWPEDFSPPAPRKEGDDEEE